MNSLANWFLSYRQPDTLSLAIEVKTCTSSRRLLPKKNITMVRKHRNKNKTNSADNSTKTLQEKFRKIIIHGKFELKIKYSLMQSITAPGIREFRRHRIQGLTEQGAPNYGPCKVEEAINGALNWGLALVQNLLESLWWNTILSRNNVPTKMKRQYFNHCWNTTGIWVVDLEKTLIDYTLQCWLRK